MLNEKVSLKKNMTFIIQDQGKSEVIYLTENIKSIFQQNILLLGDLDKAIIYFREQHLEKALKIVANSMERIKFIVEAIIKDRDYFNLVATDSVLDMLSGILEAQKNRDYILLTDLLDLQMVSFLCNVQELIINKEEILFDENNYMENIDALFSKENSFHNHRKEPLNPSKMLENGYRVEFTSCGLMTLAAKNNGSNFYFHTNSRIQSEAFLLARQWYQKEIRKYTIYGFGMGYHIFELNELAPNAEIEVYEADHHVIQLACAFTNIKEKIANKKIKLIYDPDYSLLRERIGLLTSDDVFAIHYPSFRNIRSAEAKKALENFIPWSRTLETC